MINFNNGRCVTPRPSRRRLQHILALILLLALNLVSVDAQTNLGTIRGIVRDQTGTQLGNATITIIHKATNETWSTTCNPSGLYSFSMLPPGPYQIEVELTGYKRLLQDIELQVSQDARINMKLEIGNIVEEVFVTAPLIVPDKSSPSLRTVITNEQIINFPLDGRQFLELSLLAPGTVPAAEGSAGSVRGEFAFSANGARESSNAFLLDGAYNIDPKLNSIGVMPPVSAVKEFEIQTNSYDASFGRNGGGQVNVILKSGTSQLHGSLHEFVRNEAFDSRNFFVPSNEPSPKFERNQFGGTLGGPLLKNRVFFFVDYEGRRLHKGITRTTNVPSLKERSGDFSQSLFARPIDPYTQQPFPGGRIPAYRLHPVGSAIAALYPEPNKDTPFQNYVSSPVAQDNTDQFDLRLDHTATDTSNLSIRYSLSNRNFFEPFSGSGFALVPGFGTNMKRRGQNFTSTYAQIFSPTIVNETRLSYRQTKGSVFHENHGANLNKNVGLPNLSNNPRDFGLSFITVSGFSPLGDEYNNPQQSTTSGFQLQNNTTYAKGHHFLKFGFDIRGIQQNAFRDVQSRGFLTFSDYVPITTNALADLLIGFPMLTGGATLDNPQRLRTESYSFYINDNWQLSDNFTVSAGIRYELVSPPVDEKDQASVYDPATKSLVNVGTSIPRSGYKTDRNNVAPRLGFAWTPGENADTTIRAGYGLYYDQSPLAPGEGLYFNAPFFNFNLFYSLPGLPVTLSNPFPENFLFPTPQSALTYQRDLQTPYFHHFNIGVQQQLGLSRMVELTYSGSRGRNLLASRDINQPQPSPAPFNPRPMPLFDDITAIESRATSAYNALQFKIQQRPHKGVSFLASYTLSKSVDDSSGFFATSGDPNFPQDSFNLTAERGRSSFDIRHYFSIGFGYELPFGNGKAYLSNNGWATTILGNWEVHGILTLHSGRPFTVALLSEMDNSNTGRSVLGFGANDRPNLTGDAQVGNPSPDQWFDTAAFTLPPSGSFGNAGRNILEGPGYQNLNLGLIKRVNITNSARLNFRLEAFNLLNHNNFNLPDNFFGSPTFGQILSAGSPRRLQLGCSFEF